MLLNYDLKWPHLENLSLLEWIEKHALTNIDLSFTIPKLQFPEYFSTTDSAAPTPDVFKEWPLSTQYGVTLTHVTEKPKFMQPKTNKCIITTDVYFVSPRLIIRRGFVANEGFPYADSFTIEFKLTLMQNESLKTKVKLESRVNIIKPIRFLQATVVKETENSLKEAYA